MDGGTEVDKGGVRDWAKARRQTGLAVICWVVVYRQRLDDRVYDKLFRKLLRSF